MHIGTGLTLIRVAEEHSPLRRRWNSAIRRNSPVHHAAVMKVLVAQTKFRALGWNQRQRRAYPVAAQTSILTKTAGILKHRIQPECGNAVEWLIDVRQHALVAERSPLNGKFPQRCEASFLGHAIQYSTSPTPAKHHRIRTLQGFHSFEVIKIAIVLRIVANSIHKKVSRRCIAADDRCVAMSFALRHANPGNITHHVRHAHHSLVAHLFDIDHTDRLRNIQ